MSEYGSDSNPDLEKAYELATAFGFMPLEKTNVMQWTLDDGQVVRKLANKQGKSNILFLIQE